MAKRNDIISSQLVRYCHHGIHLLTPDTADPLVTIDINEDGQS